MFTTEQRTAAEMSAAWRLYLLLHVAVETQETELRPVIGRWPGENSGEERVEELNGLAARDEDDEFVVLRELKQETVYRFTARTNQLSAR